MRFVQLFLGFALLVATPGCGASGGYYAGGGYGYHGHSHTSAVVVAGPPAHHDSWHALPVHYTDHYHHAPARVVVTQHSGHHTLARPVPHTTHHVNNGRKRSAHHRRLDYVRSVPQCGQIIGCDPRYASNKGASGADLETFESWSAPRSFSYFEELSQKTSVDFLLNCECGLFLSCFLSYKSDKLWSIILKSLIIRS